MLIKKGNLICKALVFTFAVITAMTLDSCCDDCLGGSKSNKNHNPFDNKNNNNLISINEYYLKTKTENENKEKAGFKKTNDKEFWIFGTPLFYSAKNGKLHVGKKEETESISEYIFYNYLTGFNKEFNGQIKIDNGIKGLGGNEVPPYYIILLIGDQGVGKTCIEKRIEDKNFEKNCMQTIGVDFGSKNFFNFKDKGKNFTLNIYDTSGQEKFRALATRYLNLPEIIILVYDVKNEEKFKSLDYWYGEINAKATPGAAIFVVGNKCDLIEKEELATQEKEVNDWISDKCEQK